MYARLGYRIDDIVRADLVVPRVEIRNTKRPPGGAQSKSVEGLGDVSLLATLMPWTSEEESILSGLSFTAGLEFPTGDDPEDINPANPTPPSLLTEGSGTWDVILGYRYALPREGFRLSHSTFVQFNLNESDRDFDPGDALLTRLQGTLTALDEVIPSLALEGEFRKGDEVDGTDLRNTGMSVWSVVPGVEIPFAEGWSFQASVRIPFYVNLRGTQMAPGILYGFSLSHSF